MDANISFLIVRLLKEVEKEPSSNQMPVMVWLNHQQYRHLDCQMVEECFKGEEVRK